MRSESLTLRTPEGIAFTLPLAGPVSRMLAWAVDAACVGAAGSLIGGAAGAFRFVGADTATAIAAVAYFVLQIGYGIATEWLWRGQTVGKRLLRLRVLDQHGLRLRPSQVVTRNLLRAVDSLPLCYLVGGAAMLWSRNAQRLGDFAAGTVVVRVERLRQPDLDQILRGKFNSLREQPHLEARLRRLIRPEEAWLALRALLRREELAPAARVALFAELAAHFRLRVPYPPETVDSLTDEQYVRNVVDVLFRARAE
ncbi:MAG: RDD family protein [Thermoanaerobaculia bacterium]